MPTLARLPRVVLPALAFVVIAAPADAEPALIRLRTATFDPLVTRVSVPLPALAFSDDRATLLLVQFSGAIDTPTRQGLGALGADILGYIPDHAAVIRIAPARHPALRALTAVRWAGPYHPWYRVEAPLPADGGAPEKWSILVWRRDDAAPVAARLAAMGIAVSNFSAGGGRMEAVLTPAQTAAIAAIDEVCYIDRVGPVGLDLDIARLIGGASFVHTTLGFTGQGVTVEAMDSGVRTTHVEFAGHTIPIHGPGGLGDPWHGTRVFGNLFSKGVNPAARGFLPDGNAIFAQLDPFYLGTADRYTHTAQLVAPAGPWRAVAQSNSWGHSQTPAYTTISAEMDRILFDHDIVLTQSQSNLGTTSSRPQAWAKNIVAVGGIIHKNTLTRADDCWGCNTGIGGTASTGPASDGRVKPDLAHFYDQTHTTSDSCDTCYDPGFYGTSNASPIVAGHFGLLFQMWHQGVFSGHGGAATVFDSRPHMTTAKALLINSAYRYDWSIAGPNADLTRNRQGWGMPDLQKLYDARARTRIVNESTLLAPLQTAAYPVTVAPGEPELRVTLVYADPMGNPAATVHRVNDLSLRVTSPAGTIYWGNAGLGTGNWSTPGGQANTIDIVENVFIASPAPGAWTVEVIAAELNTDGHVQTPAIDADFALVIAGIATTCYADCNSDNALTVADFGCFQTKFVAGDPYADCNADGALTVADFGCFQTRFVAGCP